MEKEERNVGNVKLKKTYTLSKENVMFIENFANKFGISTSAWLNMLLSSLRQVYQDNEKVLMTQENLKMITGNIEKVISEEAKGVKSGGQ
jgi:hypothetical protein